MELSWIAREILENAFCQLEDAEYENHAQVYIGSQMVLVEKEDFDDLKNDIICFDPDCDDEIKDKNFEDIVKEEE